MAVPLYCTLAGCLLRLQWVLYLDITFLVPMVIESSSLPTASPPCNCSAREKYPGFRLQSDSWVRLTNSFFHSVWQCHGGHHRSRSISWWLWSACQISLVLLLRWHL